MKFNWGTGIVLAFIAFISFIMYFVISMSTNKKYDHDLVTEQYYNKELKFQEDIDKTKNTRNLETNITWKKTEKGLEISFPPEMIYNKIKGKVFLYRPSNKQLDYETEISLSSHNLLIPDERLVGGRWNIYIDWEYENTAYLFNKKIEY